MKFMIYNQEFLNILSNMSAAFWGAFFAFLFGLLSLLLVKRWERFALHRNAVVKVEHLLNKYMDRICINKNLLQSTQGFLKNSKLTFNRFLDLKIEDDLDFEFENLSLINRYFRFKLGVMRINEDLQSFNHTLTRFEEMLIHGQPLPKENFDRTSESMNDFIIILSSFGEETKRLLAFCRVHGGKIKNWNLFTFPLTQTWRVGIENREVEKELTFLNQEINENEQKT